MIGPLTLKRRKRKHQRTLDLLATIQTHFPLAFPPQNATPVRPLNPGISAQLRSGLSIRGIDASSEEIRLVLAFWCSQKFYLKGFESSEFRVDISGFESCALTQAEKKNALSRKQALVNKRNAQ